LATKILTTYKQQIEGLELVPKSGGCFELSLDGELIYSKLHTGSFPDEKAILKLVGQRLK